MELMSPGLGMADTVVFMSLFIAFLCLCMIVWFGWQFAEGVFYDKAGYDPFEWGLGSYQQQQSSGRWKSFLRQLHLDSERRVSGVERSKSDDESEAGQ